MSQFRCSHTDEGLGCGHPWRFEAPYPHACCVVPGHCPATDGPAPTGLWEIRTRDSLHLVDFRGGVHTWGWLRTAGRRPDGTIKPTYRDGIWTGVLRVAAFTGDEIVDRLPEVGDLLIVWTGTDLGRIVTSVVVSIEEARDA